uniref:Secreted protein n=1 Tax=Anopheles darlingi TaxID=43151 RepID=A0A2M4DQ27_ANODA
MKVYIPIFQFSSRSNLLLLLLLLCATVASGSAGVSVDGRSSGVAHLATCSVVVAVAIIRTRSPSPLPAHHLSSAAVAAAVVAALLVAMVGDAADTTARPTPNLVTRQTRMKCTVEDRRLLAIGAAVMVHRWIHQCLHHQLNQHLHQRPSIQVRTTWRGHFLSC